MQNTHALFYFSITFILHLFSFSLLSTKSGLPTVAKKKIYH